jgi:hypothetical protein
MANRIPALEFAEKSVGTMILFGMPWGLSKAKNSAGIPRFKGNKWSIFAEFALLQKHNAISHVLSLYLAHRQIKLQ